MPIYEFQCANCKHQFEILILKEQEKRNIKCPKCHSKKIEKILSLFGVTGGEKKVSLSAKSCAKCSSHNCKSCS